MISIFVIGISETWTLAGIDVLANVKNGMYFVPMSTASLVTYGLIFE